MDTNIMYTFKEYLNENALGLKLVSDVDGVLLDFNKGFVKWMTKNHPDVKINNGKTWDYGLSPKESFKFVDEFWNSPELSKLEPFEGAKQGLSRLGRLFEVHIISALPPKFIKERTISLKGFQWKSITLKSPKIDFVISQKPKVAIEDKPSNIMKLHNAGIDVYWPKIPLTKGISVGTSYTNWNKLVKMIERKYVNF